MSPINNMHQVYKSMSSDEIESKNYIYHFWNIEGTNLLWKWMNNSILSFLYCLSCVTHISETANCWGRVLHGRTPANPPGKMI